MIVKILQDQFFPADLILLNSSAPKGMSFIETKNLDGETNLKHKQGQKELVDFLQGNHERINRRESKATLTEESSQYDIDKAEEKERLLDRDTLTKMRGAFV